MHDIECYKKKIGGDFLAAKGEMTDEWLKLQQEINAVRVIANRQLMFNGKVETDLKMFQKNYTASVGKMMTHFGDSTYELDDKIKTLKVTSEHKLIRFADIIIKEFKYLSKLHEDKILYTVGYHDKLGKQLSKN